MTIAVSDAVSESLLPDRARKPLVQTASQAEGVPLGSLEAGERGRLVAVEPGERGRRLADLGFVIGTEIAVLRRAPLGDPVEVELRGYRVCLRAADLAHLRVTPETG